MFTAELIMSERGRPNGRAFWRLMGSGWSGYFDSYGDGKVAASDEIRRLQAQLDAALKERDVLRIRAVSAEQHKVLDRLGRSSYQEVIEDGLRTKLAESEIERERLEAEVARLTQERDTALRARDLAQTNHALLSDDYTQLLLDVQSAQARFQQLQQQIAALVEKWEAQAIGINGFHATMAMGWRACAEDLATLLPAAPKETRE